MLKVHGFHPYGRDSRVRWLLNELDVPFEYINVNLFAGEHKLPEYLKTNPSGRIPYLETSDGNFAESGAMLLYLADKFPDRGLAPQLSSADRATYYQWLFYGASTLEGPAASLVRNKVLFPDAPGAKEAYEKAKADFSNVSNYLAEWLTDRKFLLGDTFTAADILVGTTLGYAKMAGWLGESKVLERYLTELQSRPAYQKTFAQ